MAKLTYRQERMLKEMVKLQTDHYWSVSGHNRMACNRLVALGYAVKCGDIDSGLSSAYQATDAGRTALESDNG